MPGQSTENCKSLKETEEDRKIFYIPGSEDYISLRQQYFPNWSTDLTKPLSKSKVDSL